MAPVMEVARHVERRLVGGARRGVHAMQALGFIPASPTDVYRFCAAWGCILSIVVFGCVVQDYFGRPFDLQIKKEPPIPHTPIPVSNRKKDR